MIARLVALAAAAGWLLALLGPFGGYGVLSFGERLSFWGPLLLFASAFHIAALWGCLQGVERWRLPGALAVVPASLLASIPTALLAAGLSVLLFGADSLPALPRLVGYVLTISLPMQTLSLLMVRRDSERAAQAARLAQAAQAAQAGAPPPSLPAPAEVAAATPAPPWPESAAEAPRPPPPLLARLPSRLGQELQCLEMQDHYVRVHTALGNTLLLMRMGDAERETDGLDGFRVHRSWWVAAAAVRKVTRQEGRPVLLLRNGQQVPVSRDRWSGLRRHPVIADLMK